MGCTRRKAPVRHVALCTLRSGWTRSSDIARMQFPAIVTCILVWLLTLPAGQPPCPKPAGSVGVGHAYNLNSVSSPLFISLLRDEPEARFQDCRASLVRERRRTVVSLRVCHAELRSNRPAPSKLPRVPLTHSLSHSPPPPTPTQFLYFRQAAVRQNQPDFACNDPQDSNDAQGQLRAPKGEFRESNPGPLAPEARIIPLDQTPSFCLKDSATRQYAALVT